MSLCLINYHLCLCGVISLNLMAIFKLTNLADQLGVINNCESTSLLNAKVGSELSHLQAGPTLWLMPLAGQAIGFDAAGCLLN